jgi:heme-degrading monooxygenase HmoA
MYVVIFRARVRSLDAEYLETVRRLREIAMNQFGCIAFHSLSEGQDEITLSYWPDEEGIRAWKAHPEHVLAQRAGRERWYESYSVQIAQVNREYRMK